MHVQHGVGTRIGDPVGEIAAGREIPQPDGEEFGARFIDRISEEPVIGRMARRTELEERKARGERLAIDQELLLAASARPPNEAGMLSAASPPAIIEERPVGNGRRRILILDPFAELLLQLLDQRGERREKRVRISVLRVEMGTDVGGQGGGVLQHLAPIGRLEPRIIIADNNTVMSNFARPRGRRGRFRPRIDDRNIHRESLSCAIRRRLGWTNANAVRLSKHLIMKIFFAAQVDRAPSARELRRRYFHSVQAWGRAFEDNCRAPPK